MDKEQVRKELLEKLEAAWPQYKTSPDLVRGIELASNDQLRRHLAMAEAAAEAINSAPEIGDELPQPDRDPATGLSRNAHTLMWHPRGGYTLAKDVCGDWYKGPDWLPYNLHSIAGPCGGTSAERACAQTLINSAGSRKLWRDIEARYSRNAITGEPADFADRVAGSLPYACARAKANWAAIPRLTPAKFKEHRDELAHRAEQLALELERFYLPRDPDESEFPGMLDFMELMSQEERDRFDDAIRRTTLRIANRALENAGCRQMDWAEYNDIGDNARALGYQPRDLPTPANQDAVEVYQLMLKDHSNPRSDWGYGGVPTLPDMLRRIAESFRADGEWPPIKNPNQRTAERSFFARALCKYFWTSFGDVSPAIVRDIVSIFYQESITEGAVSQIIRKVKEAHPLPSP